MFLLLVFASAQKFMLLLNISANEAASSWWEALGYSRCRAGSCPALSQMNIHGDAPGFAYPGHGLCHRGCICFRWEPLHFITNCYKQCWPELHEIHSPHEVPEPQNAPHMPPTAPKVRNQFCWATSSRLFQDIFVCRSCL